MSEGYFHFDMPQAVAPWLEGLDEAWEAPISSASHDASSLRVSNRREPRPNISPQSQNVAHSSIRRRSPLATLNSNNGTLGRTKCGTIKTLASRSFSGASAGSVVQYNTVQQRSKSSSPTKTKETLEWKRRLVRGEVGYGDQTDLFGPSGLENIFAPTRDSVDAGAKGRNRRAEKWNVRSSAIFPSSPPVWNEARGGSVRHESGELDSQQKRTEDVYSDFQSGPFRSDEGQSIVDEGVKTTKTNPRRGATGKSTFSIGANDTMCGPTVLEQEDFSLVHVTKHTTLNGQIDYKPLDNQLMKQMQSLKMRDRSVAGSAEDEGEGECEDDEYEPSAHSLPELGAVAVDTSEFHDGSAIEIAPGQDFSLSENLPTGTPPINGLGRHIEVQRGGYSRYGSFNHRLLSPSQSTSDHQSQVAPAVGIDGLRHSQPTGTPIRNVYDSTSPSLQPKSRSSGSPLKLFGPHDTFTNNKLLRRMSQLNLENPEDCHEETPHTKSHQNKKTGMLNPSRNVSSVSFGSGELDDQEFIASYVDNKPSEDRMQSSAVLQTSAAYAGQADFEGSVIVTATKTHASNIAVSDQQPALEPSYGRGTQKRPPNSPFKPPTPKRRRTLHASEVFEDATNPEHAHIDKVRNTDPGQKRMFHRNDRSPNVAGNGQEPSRARTPTPRHRQKDEIEAEILEATEEFAMQEPEKVVALLEHLESSMASGSPLSAHEQARAVAKEVAKFTLKVHRPSGESPERKRSITTQDFYNEAVMVMQLIRESAGRKSALGSLAESEAEGHSELLEEDYSQQDLSSLRVSRPPSREGGSRWRPRTSEQTNEKLISHLRKFEERDDTEFIAPTPDTLDAYEEPSENIVAEDAQSNIRIRGPSYHLRQGTDSVQQHTRNLQSSGFPTSGSTGERLNTSSTRKSENVGTLAPGAVAHLIGEQVGSMTFDKEKNQWVRVKTSPRKSLGGSFLELPSNVTSDDDPFREISDLPVDEIKEEEIRKISSGQRPASLRASHSDNETSDVHQPGIESRTASQETVLAWPVPGLSEPRERLPLSDPCIDDSANKCLSEEDLARLPSTRSSVTHTEDHEKTPSDIAHAHEDDLALHSSSPNGSIPSPADIKPRTIIPSSLRQSKNFLLPPKVSAVSFDVTRKQTYHAPFLVSDAYEPTELSILATLPDERMMSMSLSMARPADYSRAVGRVMESPSSPKPDQTFLLSDLPDFTVHEEDVQRPSERALAKRLAQVAASEVVDQHALTIKDMVRTLTDVQENEPYWDEVEQLSLRDRRLTSLHGLDTFCGKVRDLDVSANTLSHLHGAPPTIRQLVAQSNQLNSLTSWVHLSNLQYLDLSNNNVDNLRGLSCLIHLRELRADNNAITSLAGVDRLEGLLALSVRKNCIRNVEFQGTELGRLELLDLSENQISAISCLENLVSLSILRLDHNPLREAPSFGQGMLCLRTLSSKDCGLSQLDLSRCTSLRNINVDQNSLSSITGIEALSSLECLYMRDQHLPHGMTVSVLKHSLHARRLYISGNDLQNLDVQQNYLSLQHLEVASVGLQALPHDFGLRFPNLCSLNLNFNALKDIRSLVNIQKLEQLSVCGNRIGRLRQTMATVARLSTLIEVDFRDNPLTQGFYAPLAQSGAARPGQTVVQCRDEVLALKQHEDRDDQLRDCMTHCLPTRDATHDQQHLARLDDDTKLRRRVYELLLSHNCAELTAVDGLRFDRADTKARDAIWERLVELGVAKKVGGG